MFSITSYYRNAYIKATKRYHFTFTRMAVIKRDKKKKQMLVSMWRNWNSFALLVEMENDLAVVENGLVFPQNVKCKIIM